jgi:hypothetical protein
VARNGAGTAEPGTAVLLALVGIDLQLIESYAVQRGFDLLAVETAEEEVGLKEDWKERKELVSIADFVRHPAYSTQKTGHYHVPSAVQYA